MEIQAVVTGVIAFNIVGEYGSAPTDKRFFIECWVLLTHAVAHLASQLVHKNKSHKKLYEYAHGEISNSQNWRIPGLGIIWYATWAVSDIEPVAPVV